MKGHLKMQSQNFVRSYDRRYQYRWIWLRSGEESCGGGGIMADLLILNFHTLIM